MMNANEARAKAQEAQAQAQAELTAKIRAIVEEHIAPIIEQRASEGETYADIILPVGSLYHFADIEKALQGLGYRSRLWSNYRKISVYWGE